LAAPILALLRSTSTLVGGATTASPRPQGGPQAAPGAQGVLVWPHARRAPQLCPLPPTHTAKSQSTGNLEPQASTLLVLLVPQVWWWWRGEPGPLMHQNNPLRNLLKLWWGLFVVGRGY